MPAEQSPRPEPADAPDPEVNWVDRLSAAAIEAELETGRREETAEEARRGALVLEAHAAHEAGRRVPRGSFRDYPKSPRRNDISITLEAVSA